MKLLRDYRALFFLILVIFPSFSHADEFVPCEFVDHNDYDTQATGQLTQNFQFAMPFTVDAECVVTRIGLYTRQSDLDVDNLIALVMSDSGGQPDSTLGGAVLDVNSTEFSWVYGAPEDTLILEPATQYWLVTDRTGDRDNGDYFLLSVNDSIDYGTSLYLDDGGWQTFGNYTIASEIDYTLPDPIPPTIEATSTIEQFQNNLWQGYWSFFAMFALVLWLGRRRV